MPQKVINNFSKSSEAPEAVSSEIEEDLQIRRQRRKLFPLAALVGLGAGLVSAFFGGCIETADKLRNTLIAWSAQFPGWGWRFPVLFSVTEPSVFAVVGMAAYFSASVRTPLTGVALIVEMTGGYEQMLPLLVSCFCAYAVAEMMNNLPIYETLLERDLDRDGSGLNFTEPMLFDFEIEEGSFFSGKKICALGLPSGCLLIRYVLDGKEYVPRADTLLEDHMRITAIIAPEAEESITMIRKGCHKNKQMDRIARQNTVVRDDVDK